MKLEETQASVSYREHVLYLQYIELNQVAISRILEHLDVSIPIHGRINSSKVEHIPSGKHFPFFQLQAKQIAEAAKVATDIEVRARRAQRKLNLEDQVKGPQATRRALASKPSPPFTCLKRDRIGPKGQAIGTNIVDPREVDSIAKRAWSKIYEGNSSSSSRIAHMFLAKHRELIYRQDEFQVSELGWRAFKQSCIEAKHSAGGLGNFTLADVSLLSDEAYQWLIWAPQVG